MKMQNCYWLSFLVVLTSFLAGCSGMRSTSEGTFATHAESFRLLGYAIPDDDKVAAKRLVPANATVVSISSTPADWTSLTGIIGNILWIHQTRMTGLTAMNSPK